MSAPRGGTTPLDQRLAEIAAMEPHRHACEVRHVAEWNAARRAAFVEGIEKKRGAPAARRFAADMSVHRAAGNFGNGRQHPAPPPTPGDGR